MSQHDYEQKPNITVVGVGGAGGNAVNNMIESNLEGVDFVVANTDAQALKHSLCQNRVQLGSGLGAGAVADVGRQAAEDSAEDIRKCLEGANMAFITAGMGGGTGTGAAPVVARIAKEMGILTIGVVTKPFHFEGSHRMRSAEKGIETLEGNVDTMIMIPNQNLFRVCDANTTFADAFKMADGVLHSGVRSVTDLIVMPGLINLDFADIRSVMHNMGKAMMGMGEGSGEERATKAAQAAITNPLLDDVSMQGAQGVLINITGGMDMTLFEVDEVANRIREEVDPEAQIIFGSAFDETMEGPLRVSVVATGFDREAHLRRQKAMEEEAAKRKEAGSSRPFTVVAGDKKEEESLAAPEAAAAEGDAAPDWLKPVSDDETPGNALANLDTPEPEADAEEHDVPEPENAEREASHSADEEPGDSEPAEEEDALAEPVAAEAAPAEPEQASDEDQEPDGVEPESEPAVAAASGEIDKDLVEDVTNWITKAYIEDDASAPDASGEQVSAQAADAGSDDVAASLSKIWNETGASKKSETKTVNGHNGHNGSSNGVDVSSIFLDGSADGGDQAEAEADGHTGDGHADDHQADDDLEKDEVAARSSQRDDDDQHPGGSDSLNDSDDVSIEEDEEEEAEVPQRASGFFSGLRRGFNKPTRDEQTGKAVLERLRGCQRVNTGEA